ncbi:MAG TPA: glycosyltransferase family 39 protein [Terriglobales bacterium]|nr:glycosyltransferase family 39 protein [Terriglobales bacterium]
MSSRIPQGPPLASEALPFTPARVGSWNHWIEVHPNRVALALVALGLGLRLATAWGTYLNPDEALHFFIADRASLVAAYQANLTMAHPPLMILVLYGWRSLGTSELWLRLPSILAGTAFCWIYFRWLTRLFGRNVALAGLTLAALLPPLVSLTAEVRQYGLLLVFLIGGAYLLECATAENSPRLMLGSGACFWLALGSHYSAFLFVAVMGIYSPLRFRGSRISRPTLTAWMAGELGALVLAVTLYLTHIAQIRHTTMAEQAFDDWLRKSYFHRGHDNRLIFLVTRSFSFFQYLFGQLVVGDVLALLFIAGIVLLLRAQAETREAERWRSRFAVLLIFPFLLNYGAALFDLYPYGGTRHCVYLAIFALAAVSLAIIKMTGENALRGIAFSLLLVALCLLFRTNHLPMIARADQKLEEIDRAVQFLREQLPQTDSILADYESGIMLGHYLCEKKPISYEGSIPGFLVLHCGGHRIISTDHDLWAFTPPTFLSAWRHLVEAGYFNTGDTVWVAQVGWMVELDDELRKGLPEFRDLRTQAFGHNIRFFPLRVGSAMPPASQSLRITPAMAAGLSDRVWNQIVLMADTYMPMPRPRRPYKQRVP